MIKFKICIDKPFINCERIYPIQQNKVKQLIDCIKDNDNVNKVIIFGSSVTSKCHIGSDVDVYMELKENKHQSPINKYLPFEFDYWNNFLVDERLKNEIIKKGVVVYERNPYGQS